MYSTPGKQLLLNCPDVIVVEEEEDADGDDDAADLDLLDDDDDDDDDDYDEDVAAASQTLNLSNSSGPFPNPESLERTIHSPCLLYPRTSLQAIHSAYIQCCTHAPVHDTCDGRHNTC